MMSTARDSTSRLRAGLNPLLTSSLGMYPNQANTPLSAISLTSHNGFGPAAPTPPSTIQPYNPQEWISSPISGPDRNSGRFSSGEPQTVGPSPPPPPYSPPRSSGRPPSQMYESSPANISAVRAPATNLHRPPIPEQQPVSGQAQAFPPPPSTGRGLSRERRFGIPSLRRRDRDSAEATTPPEAHPAASAMYPTTPGNLRPLSVGITSRAPHPGPLTLQIPRAPDVEPGQIQPTPPASRRAQSTGAINTPTSARSRSSSQVRWEPGMPVPPPPPGPPPGPRSQSVSRPNSGGDPTRRPPPSGVTALGPVPPTPANWTEETDVNAEDQGRGRSPPAGTSRSSLADSVHTTASSVTTPGDSTASSPGPAGLARTGAVRGEKTLRERRNESRTRGARDSIDASLEGSQNSCQLSDIIIPGTNQLSRRLTISRGTPRSGGRSSQETPRTGGGGDDASRNATPRPLGSAEGSQYPADVSTPPISPRPQKHYQLVESGSNNPGNRTAYMAPKALPTPPPQNRSASSSQTRLTLVTATPMSASAPTPMSPCLVTKETVVKQTADQFCRGTIERFKAFAHKEAAAANDAERVRLFADFIVSESRVRRERYAASIGAMGSEIFDLTRDLFRPMSTPARRESTNSQMSLAEFTPQTSEPPSSRSHRGSMGSMYQESLGGVQSTKPTVGQQSNSAPPSAGLPPPSPGPPGSGGQNWQQSNYMPSLSPILSMSVSDAHDEQDSRGRSASRWWEAESTGHSSMRIERSKRESKYMGVPKEAREALQWVDDPDSLAGSSSQRDPSSDYPPEKTGWHDAESQPVRTPQALPYQPHFRDSLHSLHSSNFSGPSTPCPPPLPPLPSSTPVAPAVQDPSHLDVSRLVTLPPPYPRHHPAVNNNHPELTETRNAVRDISDMSEVEATKSRFAAESKKKRDEAAAASKRRVTSLRQNLQREITTGNMSYAEAAAIEADSAEAERAALKELEKADFERFQSAVVAPLNDILTSRIATATGLFDGLRGRLFVETREPSPNMPQEEGDERPELLEQLTLLKWIFEAREALHRAIYDLLSDRNDRYRDVVLTPYRLSGNQEKLTSARAFFAEDAAKRAAAFAAESLQRTREFRDVVEENVSRGVEVQLSAFWDIAPPLKQLLDEVPHDLRGFRIQVPAKELLENPSYGEHPLQHLFSVLLHAEKSTYQFIESQTNLLCLLHEVKEAVATARARAVEADRELRMLTTVEDEAALQEEQSVEEMKAGESRRLTEDLKEKVRVVQDQWNSALGDCITGVKERVGGWLLETGGWDESFEEGGVGGV